MKCEFKRVDRDSKRGCKKNQVNLRNIYVYMYMYIYTYRHIYKKYMSNYI